MDPDGNTDRHQNLYPWSLGHALPLQENFVKIRSQLFQLSDGQTNRQTDQSKNITSFLGGGNNNNNTENKL